MSLRSKVEIDFKNLRYTFRDSVKVTELYFKEVKEEIFVITTQGMIGSVGGSLGMFFGFSFSAFVLYLIEKIIKRTSVQA